MDVAATFTVLFTICGAVLERGGAGVLHRPGVRAARPASLARSRRDGAIVAAGFLLGTVSGSGVADHGDALPHRRADAEASGYPGAWRAACAGGGWHRRDARRRRRAAAFIIAEYLRGRLPGVDLRSDPDAALLFRLLC